MFFKYVYLVPVKLLFEYNVVVDFSFLNCPTVFGIFDSKDKMEGAAAVLRESGLARTVFATEIYNRNGGDTNDK